VGHKQLLVRQDLGDTLRQVQLQLQPEPQLGPAWTMTPLSGLGRHLGVVRRQLADQACSGHEWGSIYASGAVVAAVTSCITVLACCCCCCCCCAGLPRAVAAQRNKVSQAHSAAKLRARQEADMNLVLGREVGRRARDFAAAVQLGELPWGTVRWCAAALACHGEFARAPALRRPAH